MHKNSPVLILGSTGLLGSALKRLLTKSGHQIILSPTRTELDLTKQNEVLSYFEKHKPQYVINAAAKVGGIIANNNFPADFIFQNLSIQNNVFEACFKFDVTRLLFIASSCIYPKHCPQPMKEEYLLTGELEKTNDAFAVAKIAGLKMAESFCRQYQKEFYTLMPTSLYGPNDNFSPTDGHVIAGLIHRMHLAIKNDETHFEVWGSGNPRREFLHVDDFASACLFLLNYKGDFPWSHLNAGYGEDISICELAKLIGKLMGFKGTYTFNSQYPDGTPRKLLDSSKINQLGWKPQISFEEGLKETIQYYLENKA